MHIVTLPSGSVTSADYRSFPATPAKEGEPVPEKRAGHTAVVIGERIFVFGGRGGREAKPLEEKGRVWVYDTRTDKWSFLDPMPATPYPEARFDHATVAVERPQSSAMKSVKNDPALELPATGTIAKAAQTDEGMGGYGTVFVHAGCLANGRTNDIWAFDVASRTWRMFPDAPGAARSGSALTISKQRIYRYGGFNGETGEGGVLDVLELGLETYNDKGGQGEMAVCAKGVWGTLDFQEEGMKHPGKRSVAGLQTITTGMGREYLILIFGESSPREKGHDGAGGYLGDVWAFQAPPLGMTGASFKDATWQALGKETGEGLWSQVVVSDAEGEEGDDVRSLVPSARGSFASSTLGDLDNTGIILWGGLNDRNESADDGWILTLG